MNAGSAPWPATACLALGSSTLLPRWSIGVTTMKMMSSTSTTSTSGVMLMSERTPLLVASDRKSTRLNSSHLVISYAVFCLKKKKSQETATAQLQVYEALDHHLSQ